MSNSHNFIEMDSDDDAYIVIIEEDDKKEDLMTIFEIKKEETDFSETGDLAYKQIKIEIDLSIDELKEELEEETLEEDLPLDNSKDVVINSTKKKPISKKLKSYVKKLKCIFPELRKDKKLLITCLSGVMRDTKRPPPPRDHFVMKGDMLECVKCGFQSSSIPKSDRHYQEKHGERYLYCFACGDNFRSTTNLYKHEKKCSAPDAKIVLRARALTLGRKGRSRPYIPKDLPPIIRQYECSQCSAVYFSKAMLQTHEHLHTGERPHRCHVCGAAYASRTALCRHVRIHSGVRYTCDHCQRSFKQKSGLVTHMDTHLRDKRFACEQCPKRYSQKAALVLHVDREHRGLPPPIPCQLCPRRYARMTLLREHMKKVHGMDIITRKMFYKKLPTLSDTQVREAKVILKSEVDKPKIPI